MYKLKMDFSNTRHKHDTIVFVSDNIYQPLFFIENWYKHFPDDKGAFSLSYVGNSHFISCSL